MNGHCPTFPELRFRESSPTLSVAGSMDSRWKFSLAVKSALAPNIDESLLVNVCYSYGNGLVPPASPENLTYFGTYLKRHPRLLC